MHPNTFISELWAGEELDEVFVAMSFSEQYQSRFDHVFRPAIEQVLVNNIALRATRVDESKSGDSIITDILRGIAQARIVVADISVLARSPTSADVFRNGNVMYELGLAHAVKSPAQVIIVRDDQDKLLFDVSSIPHATIDFNDVDGAKSTITRLLCDRIEEGDKVVDIKLRNFLASMTPDELRVLESLATCPKGKIMDLTVQVSGRRLTPFPTNAGLLGLRSAGLVQAHHIQDSTVPLYSLTERGRKTCSLLGIKPPGDEAAG
jgi:hypothetical protein